MIQRVPNSPLCYLLKWIFKLVKWVGFRFFRKFNAEEEFEDKFNLSALVLQITKRNGRILFSCYIENGLKVTR